MLCLKLTKGTFSLLSNPFMDCSVTKTFPYVVLETDKGNVFVTEQSMNGKLTWVENPPNLEDRNSLAKVVRSSECDNARSTIRDMKTYYQARETEQSGTSIHRKHGNDYAQNAYSLAIGTTQQVVSGFRHPG